MLNKLKKLFAPRDLTVGNTLSGIVMFAIPLLIGNLAQQLYNTVDAIVVGQYVGDAALGAVGLAGPVITGTRSKAKASTYPPIRWDWPAL